jgi:succinate dehydrogenase / fumarate reductase cytochrome b subunit
LFWDMGKGLDLPAAYRSGWIVIAAAIVLTISGWVCGYYSMGAL